MPKFIYPIIWLALVYQQGKGGVLSKVIVEGDDRARIIFKGGTEASIQVKGNVIDVLLPKCELGENLGEKVDLDSPHPLLNRLSVFPVQEGIKAHFVVRGSIADLKDRTRVENGVGSVQVEIDFPRSASLHEMENTPVSIAPQTKTLTRRVASIEWVIMCGSFLAIGGVFAVFYHRLKKRSLAKGPRKFLIQNMSTCSLGPRVGVALLKIGSEFVLVGISPERITYLSSVPKLALQYDEDSRLDRSAFNEAIEEEAHKQQKPYLTV